MIILNFSNDGRHFRKDVRFFDNYEIRDLKRDTLISKVFLYLNPALGRMQPEPGIVRFAFVRRNTAGNILR